MKTFSIDDVKQAECTLEPIECVHCKSLDVTYQQYIGDAYCADCGQWQEEVAA